MKGRVRDIVAVVAMLMTSNVRVDVIFPPCLDSPNCVSSQAVGNHRIAPLRVAGDAVSAFERLRDILSHRADTALVSADKTTIRVEFKATLGFIDDGLFMLDTANGFIHVRSAARLGYWDLGKNRRRMEEIRKSYYAE